MVYNALITLMGDFLMPSKDFGGAKYISAKAFASDFSLYDPVPYFRRTFNLSEGEICRGEIFVQSPGFATVYINGKAITEDIFISPISDFSKIRWYNSYDVTSLLHVGENVIVAIAGNGFFNESFESAWSFGKAGWRSAPEIMICLRVNGEEKLVTDETWRVSLDASHIIFSHLRSGEYVDMRKYDERIHTAEYDDSAFGYAVVKDTDDAEYTFLPVEETGCPPVRECESIEPKSIKKIDTGYLIDFGVNMSGYVKITVKEERGKEIVLRFAEEVDEVGKPCQNGMIDGYYTSDGYEFQVDKIIASGTVDTFKPSFTYHGFRYVIVEGLTNEPKASSVTAYFIHNDLKKKADFTSGDDIINFIYKAGMRSVLSNAFWSLTDCPTREKLGWLNDAQASAEVTLINFDIIPFYKKWYEDIKSDQTESGELHGVVPTWGWGLGWGPVCDYYLFELPWRIYLYTGSPDMLVDAIPNLLRYEKLLSSKLECDGDDAFILADWLGTGNSEKIPKRFIWDAYHIKALRVLKAAMELGGADPSGVSDKLVLLEERFIGSYFDRERCLIDEQTALAMAISLELYPDKSAISVQMVSAVIRDGIKLTSGMVGVQYVYDALSECGRADLAYKIITESDPGYKTWYDRGATTLWEVWDGVHWGSHNHHMYSNVIGWFFKSVLGIAPSEKAPGFAHVELRPRFIRNMGYARGYEITPHGKISAEWRYKDGGFYYTVTVPEGASISYLGKALTVGENKFFISEENI